MPFSNSYPGFLYRQFFVHPPPLPGTLSLASRTGIVTGSNTGLGYHTSAQLLERGLSRLILAVRDPKKGKAARKSLLAGLGKEDKQPLVEVWQLDLESYGSAVAFVEKAKKTEGLKIDFAILNAGVVKSKFEINKETGHEVTVQTNWLSTGLLAMLLVPVLQLQYNSAGSTGAVPVVTIVGSEVAQWAKMKEGKKAVQEHKSVVEALDNKKNFDPSDRYYASKLLLLFFFREFASRLETPGTRGSSNDVVINNVNPGFCYGSDLHRDVDGVFGTILGVVKRIMGRSTPLGARTLAHAAVVASAESHGKYLSDGKITAFADYPLTLAGRAMQKQLWEEMAKEFKAIVDIERIMRSKI